MIEKLRKLGLSPYESKCYLALVRYGNLLGKDIAEKSGVPPTSVYRNLEALQKRGLVQIVQKEPLVYQAVDPSVALPAYIKKQKEDLEKVQEETIRELSSIKRTGLIEKQEEVLEVYSGRKQSYELGKRLINQAKKKVLFIGRGTPQSVLDLIHPLKSAVKRDVSCKFIVTTDYRNTDDRNKSLIDELKKAGVKIKYNPLQGFSLVVKDGEESQIVIKDDKLKEERIVLRIRSKDLSQAHAHYFESVWRKSTPL